MSQNSNTTIIIPVDKFEKVCRVCLAYCEDLISIHEIVFTYAHSLEGPIEHIFLSGVLEKYCDILVHKGDLKPQNICELCMRMLAKAFDILDLFRLSNLRLDKILKEHASKIDEIRPDSFTILSQESSDQSEATTGIISDNVDCEEEYLEIKIEEPEIDFQDDILTESNEGLKEHFETDFQDHVLTESNEDLREYSDAPSDPLINDRTGNKRLQSNICNDEDIPLNLEIWDHTYCDAGAKYSNIVRGPNEENEVKKPHFVKPRIKKLLNEQQLKRMVLKYQHKHEIFKCRFCKGLHFQGADKIIEHMKTHHPLIDECIICAKKFSKTELLVPHLASHAKKRNLVCNKCFIFFKDKESLESHYDSEEHKMSNSKCHICGKEFRRRSRLKRHIQEVHLNAGQDKSQCPKCGLILKYSGNFRKHLRTHKEMKERKSFLCEHCATCFTTSSALKKHVLIHHEGQIHLKRRRSPHIATTQKSISRSISTRTDMVYSCDYCPRTFRGKGCLFRHRNSHPECKDVVCPTCGKTLANPMAYRQHRVAEHSTYRCDKCLKGWPTKQYLAIHKYQSHSKYADRLMCSYCPASFKTSQTLRIHECTHTKEKPYSCEYCGKKFTQKPHVTQHIMCMHTKVKKYHCNICDKAFTFGYSFKAHLRGHMGFRPFSCPYCAKGFTNTVSRHKHVKNFHPEKMEDFIAFKKIHQPYEAQCAESLLDNVDGENERSEEVLMGADESLSRDESQTEDYEGLPENAETVYEYVFSPRGESMAVDSYFESNE